MEIYNPKQKNEIKQAMKFLLGLIVMGQVSMSSISIVYAQASATLYDPLVPGASAALPYMPAGQPLLEAPGDGPIPRPVTPGMIGPPTLIPSILSAPADLINSGSNGIPIPTFLPLATPPGVARQMFGGPPPASTPGMAPGMLPGTTSGYMPPAIIAPAGPGGLMGQAPISRWGGQVTRDFGLIRTRGSQTTNFGQPLQQVAVVQPSTQQDGPLYNGNGGMQIIDNGPRTFWLNNSSHAMMTIAPK